MRPTASTDAVGGSCVQLGTSSEDEVAHGPNNRAASSASIQKMDAVAEDSDEAQQTHISDVSIASTGIVPPVAHPGIAFPPRTPLAWRPVGIICHPSVSQNGQETEVKLGGTVQMWVAPENADRADKPTGHPRGGASQDISVAVSVDQKLGQGEEKAK